jgi:hypothetical protein
LSEEKGLQADAHSPVIDVRNDRCYSFTFFLNLQTRENQNNIFFILRVSRRNGVAPCLQASEAVGLDIPGKGGMLADPNIRLGANIALYNIRLEELKDEPKSWESDETRLEKALKMLPAIKPEKLKPSPDSLKQLKDDILKDAKGEEWLRTKVLSLECGDGFNFKELLNE